MAYPGRHSIYKATIRRMVEEAIQAQDAAFKEQHAHDSDEQLLGYLRSGAVKLNHSPWPGEIIGGSYLTERFGSWERALSLACLPSPQTDNRPETFLRVIRETERQIIVYRQRKARKKILAQKRRAQQNAKKKQNDIL